MEPDVTGFKKGLAGIMKKHQLSCLEGIRGAFIGYWGNKETQFALYCKLSPSTLPEPFTDIFEQPKYDMHDIVSDIKDLFDYYNVRMLGNQYLETFFIGPDDNNQFLMEHVELEFFETKIKGDN
ncbi:hypothetical protein [Halalkalibacter krulwichiae]|uniref:Uncharacterized protein n=1 Tax=Halalkalibacter krulwichiae TaxID=199441 RepID=A0A1X9MKG7_9BACI|nr:hypothetical protein [Halalkalibacter krulwichiae]ARK32151.1 hypothetical protein BkAM31D_21160 [Halalkalibacter krulwichiae]